VVEEVSGTWTPGKLRFYGLVQGEVLGASSIVSACDFSLHAYDCALEDAGV
jgi:hypothetical protein